MVEKITNWSCLLLLTAILELYLLSSHPRLLPQRGMEALIVIAVIVLWIHPLLWQQVTRETASLSLWVYGRLQSYQCLGLNIRNKTVVRKIAEKWMDR